MAVTASESRYQLFTLIEQVNDDHRPIEILSKLEDAVLMLRADFRSLGESAPSSGGRRMHGGCGKPSSRPAGGEVEGTK